MSAGLIVSLRGRWSFSSPESSRNWPQQPSSSQDRARRRFRVVDTERSASSRVSTDGRRQSETVRARAREVGGGASSSPASENEPDAFRSRSGIFGARSGSVGGRGQGRTNGTASGDRGVGDAEHQMGDGGRFVGGGGGVWARGGVFRSAWRGDATSAADELGEGSGSTFRASTGSGVQRVSAAGACPVTPSSACPATRNIWVQRVFCRRRA